MRYENELEYAADAYAQKSAMTPADALDRLRYGNVFGYDPNAVSQEQASRYKAETFLDDAGPVFRERIQNPVFRAAVSGAESKYKQLEQEFLGFKSTDSNLFTKSVLRGVADAAQAKNGLSAYSLRTEIERLEKDVKDYPNREDLKTQLASAYKEADELAEKITYYALRQDAFNVGSYTDRVSRGDYDALDFVNSVGEQIVQSGVTMAPAALTALLASIFAPAGIALGATAATTFAGSFSVDYGLGLVNKMREAGYDPTNKKDVYEYITKAERFNDDRFGSALHAGPVGAFDAAAQVMGGRAMRKAIGDRYASLPTAAALYVEAQHSGVAKAVNRALEQSLIQGTMGAAGEASGQLLEKHEITDPMAIVYEFAAEIGMSPFETISAINGAQRDASVRTQIVQANQQRLANIAATVENLTEEQASDETLGSYAEALAAADPAVSTIAIDLNSLAQDEAVINTVINALPGRADDVRNAMDTGGTIEVPIDEYIKILRAEQKARDAIIANSAVAGNPSAQQAMDSEKAISESRKFAIDRFAKGQSEQFRNSYYAVYDQLDDIVSHNVNKDRTVRSAILSLTMAQISVMATETGMLPHEIWDKHGIQGILTDKDIRKNDDGTYTPLSPEGKKAFSNSMASLHQVGWHGSPAHFNGFHSDHIGEGEGAQVHGWGHYIALSREKSAKYYRNRLVLQRALDEYGNDKYFPTLDDFYHDGMSEEEVQDTYYDAVGSYLTTEGVSDLSPATRKILYALHKANNLGNSNFAVSLAYLATPWGLNDLNGMDDVQGLKQAVAEAGALYGVHIPDDNQMLHEGLALSEQDATVAQAVNRLLSENGIVADEKTTGKEAYAALAKKLSSPKAASLALADNGVLGIRYDGKRDGPCAVVFRDQDATMLFESSLFQGEQGEFLVDSNTIILWSKADRSTLLHETGHWFLKTRVAIAKQLKARGGLDAKQQRFVDTTEAAVKWLGATDIESFASMSLEDSRSMQEKFARTYEQYIKEGNAPNSGLVAIFRRFSSWLKKIYGALKTVPGSDLKPDVRELFDNLFVSSEQVAEAKIRRQLFANLENLPRDADGNVVGDKAMAALNAYFSDHDDAALEVFHSRGQQLVGYLNRLRQKVIGDLEQEAQETRDRLTEEEIMRVMGPRYANALSKIQAGVPRMDKNSQIRMVKPKFYVKDLKKAGLTKEQIAKLKGIGMTTETDGIHAVNPEAFVSGLGYTGLDEFIQEFTTDHFGGMKPEDFVAPAVEDRMEDEYPELLTHESIQDSADAAVFNPTASSVVELEINLLDNAAGKENSSTATNPVGGLGKVVALDLFKAIAHAEISGKKISDLRIHVYRNEATSCGINAQKLIAEGKFREAAIMKRRQLVAMQKAEQAQNIKDRTESFIRGMKKKFQGKPSSNSLQLPYLEQIDNALTGIGIIDYSFSNVEEWNDFFSREVHYAPIPQMPDAVVAGKPFDEMTMGEVEDTIEFVNQFIKAGQKRNHAIVDGKRVSMKLIDDELSAAFEQNAINHGRKPVRQNDKDNDTGLNAERAGREFFLSHNRFSTLWATFEGTKFGKAFKYIGKRVDDCRNRANDLKTEKAEAFFKEMKILRGVLRDKTTRYYASLGGEFTRRQILSMALNIGNASNFERLLDGSDKYIDFRAPDPHGKIRKWTRQDVLTAIGQTLTYKELESVQRIWNICGSLGKELQDLDARTRNTYVESIEPKAVVLATADGKAISLAGGYYPVAYDREASNFDDADKFGDGLNKVPPTRKSSQTWHSEERKKLTGNPIALNPNAGFEGLNDVINDVCWREVLIDINKIIGPHSKTRHVIQKYYGKSAIREIEAWAKDIATNGKSIPVNKWENWIRRGVSIAGLGLNPITAALQPLGMTQSIAVVGGKWCSLGMLEYAKNPPAANRKVMAKSKLMASRSRTRFKELSEVQRQFTGTTNEVMDAFARAAFKHIVVVQMQTVDIPTWLGAYSRFMEEGRALGLKPYELEEYAVSRADRMVVDAQGSGDMADLARLERKKNVWNVFYSFFGTALNAAIVSGKTEHGMKRAMSILLILAIQPILESFLREGIDRLAGDDDDDDYLEAVAKRAPADMVAFALGMGMYVRELAPATAVLKGESPYNYSGPSGTRLFADSIKLAAQLGRDDWDKSTAKATVSFLGDILGLPSVVINRIIDSAAGDDSSWYNYFIGYKDN